MNDKMIFTLHNRHQEMTLSQFYSNTWDVLVGRGEEEDYHVHVLARFDKRSDAEAFIGADGTCRDEYVIGIRPPHEVVRAGIAWLTLISKEYIETVREK